MDLRWLEYVAVASGSTSSTPIKPLTNKKSKSKSITNSNSSSSKKKKKRRHI